MACAPARAAASTIAIARSSEPLWLPDISAMTKGLLCLPIARLPKRSVCSVVIWRLCHFVSVLDEPSAEAFEEPLRRGVLRRDVRDELAAPLPRDGGQRRMRAQ